MNWFSDLIGGAVDKVVDSVGNALDKLFTSDEERMKAQVLLDKVRSELQLELGKQALEYDKEVSERWKSDNEHLITRIVRPSVVVWVYALFTAVVLADGNIGHFHVNPAYIQVIETIIVTVTVAYFGSRGVEKVSKFVKGGAA